MLRLKYQIEKECCTMKKIFRLLLLGFLTVTVLSPSIVTAEDQIFKDTSSSLYSEVDDIVPMTTPDFEEVVLRNGESYDFIRKTIFFPKWPPLPPFTLFKIKTISGEREAFSVQFIDRAPDSESRPRDIKYIADSVYEEYESVWYGSEETEVHELGYRITNFSAGPVAYRFGMNIAHGSHNELPFELP